MTTDPIKARNNVDDDTDSTDEGQVANPGPIPPAPEDAADSGEGSSSSRLNAKQTE